MDERRGLVLGVVAYFLWGLFPLYWPLLEPAGAGEVLGHRVVWSALMMAGLLVVARRWSQFVEILHDRRRAGLLVAAAAFIAVNWGTYIWAVNHERVVEASLGYFINPLVSMLMGVLVLKERMTRLQWAAVGVAVLAVVVLTLDYGRPPWVALVLAFSFGTYGLLKKQANTGAVESLAFETGVSAPVALGYLVWLGATGGSHFTGHGVPHVLLLLGTGVVTAVPLILFGAAAVRVTMVQLGLLQYLAPIIQFLLGVLVFHEAMSSGRWAGFALVWVALAMFTLAAVQRSRRPAVPVPVAVPGT